MRGKRGGNRDKRKPLSIGHGLVDIPDALSEGVKISINPDTHSINEIDNIRWGVSAAHKGGHTKEMTWNAQPLNEIIECLKYKKKG